MADEPRRRERPVTGNRPPDRQQDRGPKKPSFKRTFEVGGTREVVELSVKIVRDDQLASGEKIRFWLGTDAQKHQKPLEDKADPARPKVWEPATIAGYVQAKINLSKPEYAKYSHITVEHGNYGWEETQPLPVAGSVSTDTGSSQTASTPSDAPDLIVEPNKIAEGDYHLRLNLYAPNGRAVSGKIRLTGNAPYSLDAQTAAMTFTPIEVTEEGKVVRVQVTTARLELDLDVVGWNKKHQLTLFGPPKQTEPARPGDGILKHLFSGWK